VAPKPPLQGIAYKNAGTGVYLVETMSSNASTSAETFQRRILWIGVVLILLALTVATLRSRHAESSAASQTIPSSSSTLSNTTNPSNRLFVRGRSPLSDPTHANPVSANETVTLLLQRFAESRRALLQQFANRLGINSPPEFQAFFDAVAANRWEDIDRIYTELSALRHREDVSREFVSLWPVIHETLGVAEVVHEWPAQALLDYGQLVLDSVPPGGVYVGGTDEGRFIPTLLNASAEEPKIILTQNALADATYMEYIRFQYDPQFKLPTENQTQEAFQRIVEKYGEKKPDGRVQVSGQDAVMAINSLLLEQRTIPIALLLFRNRSGSKTRTPMRRWRALCMCSAPNPRPKNQPAPTALPRKL
jgi:hypothetical protein